MKKPELPDGIEEVPDETLNVEELLDKFPEENPKRVDENRKTDILPKVEYPLKKNTKDVEVLEGTVYRLTEKVESLKQELEEKNSLEDELRETNRRLRDTEYTLRNRPINVTVNTPEINKVLMVNPTKGKLEKILGSVGMVLGTSTVGVGIISGLAAKSESPVIAGILMGSIVFTAGGGLYLAGKFKRWYYNS